MPAHGQLSFDFMFAVLAALLFIQALTAFAEDLGSGSGVVSIVQQEQQVALGVADAVRRAEAFSGGTGSVSYAIPNITVSGFSAHAGCDVAVAGDSVTVTVDGLALGVAEGDIVQSAPIGTGSALTASWHCGQEVTIG